MYVRGWFYVRRNIQYLARRCLVHVAAGAKVMGVCSLTSLVFCGATSCVTTLSRTRSFNSNSGIRVNVLENCEKIALIAPDLYSLNVKHQNLSFQSFAAMHGFTKNESILNICANEITAPIMHLGTIGPILTFVGGSCRYVQDIFTPNLASRKSLMKRSPTIQPADGHGKIPSQQC